MMNKIFESIEKEVVGIEMDGYDLASIFTEHLEEFGVEVSIHSIEEIPSGFASSNGYFNSFEWEEEINIELALLVHDEEEEQTINKESWEFLRHQVQATIEHEMIHREQIQKRNGLVSMPLYEKGMTEKQKRIIYLSDPDEIEAYANDVCLDLRRTYTCYGAVLKLQEYGKIKKEDSPILHEYVTLFGPRSEIVKSIVKKAVKTLSN